MFGFLFLFFEFYVFEYSVENLINIVERFQAYRVPEREVNVKRDVCSDKWTATSRDVNGMPISDGSLDSLVERIIYAVHVHIKSNGNQTKKGLIIRVIIPDENGS